MPLSLLRDEHIPYAILDGLRGRGIDAISVQRSGLRSSGDPPILEAAHQGGRVLYTWDSDFLALDRAGVQHSGIFFHAEKKYSVGQAIDALVPACQVLSPNETRNRVEFL